MDIDPPVPPSSAPKKPKFTPKAPPRRKTGPVLPKNENGDDDGEAAQALLRKVKERLGTRGHKVVKKCSGNVTMSNGAASSSTLSRTYGQPKDGNSRNNSNLRDSAEKSIMLSSSTATKDGDIDQMLVDDGFESSSDSENEYKEPWNYQSNYPTSLPWRLPHSGDPEYLDKQEFGEEKEYVEKNINSALELGLLDNNEERQMILFQFPPKLPFDKQTGRVPVSSKGKEKIGSSSSLKEDALNRCSLKDLPDGKMGKMLVYRSGAIKFKLGDIIFDVSPGLPCECHQDVGMINTKRKDCCVLGKLNKKAVVTPDFNSILDNINLS